MRQGLVAVLASVIVLEGLAMGQKFPAVAESRRIEMLKPPGKRPVRMVLDTDTYNEIDDQFALVYTLISPEVSVQAVYAAPFHNNRSSGPGDGMEKSRVPCLRLRKHVLIVRGNMSTRA